MDDFTTVDGLSQGMDRHARHLRLEKIARPEQGDAAAIPRGKASVDFPTPTVGAAERFLAEFVDAVGHEQIGLKTIDEVPHARHIQFALFDDESLDTERQFWIGEKSRFGSGASREMTDE